MERTRDSSSTSLWARNGFWDVGLGSEIEALRSITRVDKGFCILLSSLYN